MQENDFEKEVRQKLDGLHFAPSEPVWQNIEAAIRKKRKRRLVLWLLPLMLTGGLLWWQATGQREEAVPQHAQKTSPQKPGFSNPHIERPLQKKAAETPVVKKQKQPHATPASITSNTQHQNKEPVQQAFIPNDNFKSSISNNTVEKKSAGKKQNADYNSSTEAEQKNSKSAALDKVVPNVVQPNRALESEKKIPPTDTAQAIPVLTKDSLQNSKPPIQMHKKGKWKWSIAGRMGASNLHAGLFSGSANKVFQSDLVPTGNVTGQSSCIPCVTDNAYSFRGTAVAAPSRGMQFSIGAAVKKHLFKNTYLTAGLQYGFYSYHLVVGAELVADSANFSNRFDARKVFRSNGPQSSFTNALHVIELPVGLEHQLLKKRPLHLRYGIAILQTIASRALQFDSRTNTYYQSTDGLRKTNFGLFTTVDYTVWKNKAFSVQAGPHLQYGLRPVFKNTTGSYLVSGGIAVNMAF